MTPGFLRVDREQYLSAARRREWCGRVPQIIGESMPKIGGRELM
jgi:hypothetical protein